MPEVNPATGSRAGSTLPRTKRLDRLYASPALILATVAVSTFLAEAAVMVVLSFLDWLSNPALYLVDSLLLIALLFPLLVFLVFRPLDLHLAQRKRVEEELRGSMERLRSLSGHLQRAREEERRAVGREIHDELGQLLATVQLGVSSLREYRDHGQLLAKIDGMEGLLASAIGTVQSLSARLRPPLLDELGLAEAIEWQAAEFRSRTGIPCTLDLLLDDPVADSEAATAVFRIFQESLTNVMRHAGATRVEASLEQRGGRLVLRVADDGRGITPEQLRDGRSLGLTGMRERAFALGGRLRICRTRQRATVVLARIPFRISEGELCPTRSG